MTLSTYMGLRPPPGHPMHEGYPDLTYRLGRQSLYIPGYMPQTSWVLAPGEQSDHGLWRQVRYALPPIHCPINGTSWQETIKGLLALGWVPVPGSFKE